MHEIKAYAPGIYARSEELVQATRDADRNRATDEMVERGRDADVKSFLDVQREAGLDYLSDGLLSWQDIFRPFSQSVRGITAGPLTRSANTNTFFRAPLVEANRPYLEEPLAEPYFRIRDLPRGGWVATLPSPYTLAVSASGEIEPKAVAEEVIGPQIRCLSDNGCAMVVLQEILPLDHSVDVRSLNGAIRALESPVPLALQLPFKDAGSLLSDLMETEVEAIGIDFYSTDVAALPRPFPKTLLAGVIDARNSLLEDPEAVAEFGRRLIEMVGGELHLVPNGDLQFVPERIACEKVKRLGSAARILRDTAIEEGDAT